MPQAPEAPPPISKGIPRCHTDVTMRLETPVVYFHSREGFDRHFDVSVTFGAGWLTQFYPEARVHAFGIKDNQVGSLRPGEMARWNGVISFSATPRKARRLQRLSGHRLAT